MEDNTVDKQESTPELPEKQQVQQNAKSPRPKDKEKEKKSLSARISSVLGDYKGEFKKIMWPSKKDLVKKTITVVFMSLLIGLIIAVMDFAFGYGQQIFANFVR